MLRSLYALVLSVVGMSAAARPALDVEQVKSDAAGAVAYAALAIESPLPKPAPVKVQEPKIQEETPATQPTSFELDLANLVANVEARTRSTSAEPSNTPPAPAAAPPSTPPVRYDACSGGACRRGFLPVVRRLRR